MSRRIVTVFAIAACAAIAAPAGADPECFDGVCRMPEVIEAPDPSAAQASAAPQDLAGQELPAQEMAPPVKAPQVAAPKEIVQPSQTVTQQAAPQTAPAHSHPALSQRLGPAPEPIRPKMRVDEPRRQTAQPPRPRPGRAIEPAIEYVAEQPEKQHRRAAAQQPPADEPVEVVSRRYAAEPSQVYAPRPVYHVQPSAGVVVVAPGAQYGADGIAVANARQDSSWRLCQVDRPGNPHNRCIQYNYQPYGTYGYRPLGSYRDYKPSPSYVYVPDAKVISLD